MVKKGCFLSLIPLINSYRRFLPKIIISNTTRLLFYFFQKICRKNWIHVNPKIVPLTTQIKLVFIIFFWKLMLRQRRIGRLLAVFWRIGLILWSLIIRMGGLVRRVVLVGKRLWRMVLLVLEMEEPLFSKRVRVRECRRVSRRTSVLFGTLLFSRYWFKMQLKVYWNSDKIYTIIRQFWFWKNWIQVNPKITPLITQI